MSISEIYHLFEITLSDTQDGSLLANARRQMNGMKPSDIRNVLNE